MPERDPVQRASDFDEVNLGFTARLAVEEAERCLRCPRAKCIEGCPVGVRIDEFIVLVAEGRFEEAARVIEADNALPAVCGRVCPQEAQCEGACVLIRKGRPIAIGHLERFVADFQRDFGLLGETPPPPPSGHRVAVVGSGPAGLACASDLARAGHAVTLFEALHEPGGVLVYGIPEYRLPRQVVRAEIERLGRLGIELATNIPVGLALTIDDLLGEYDAVFLGVGAGLPRFLGIPGENLVGAYSANEFLTRVNLMKAHLPGAETPVQDLRGRRVAVFGAGNTAMDAVRTGLRLGAAEATVFYRRTRDEMPARAEEIRHAEEEGVRFSYLTAPLELRGDANGRLQSVTLQEMRLGEPGEDGRRRPEPIPGARHEEPADVAIVAIGNAPNPMIARTDTSIRHTSRGTIDADPATGRTSRVGVFAGGDIVTGGAIIGAFR